ncbi:UNVERIFIED_CONTAM: Exonuclease 1 [Sesamum angustifolium]|uniref:Exonuclease 1 n=1 Tax=Sesamum angustifolium TaxID=2727405 RepID=A0AAW2LJZ7_9LAMI
MGINNLLKFMKPYVEPVHIKKYAGRRVGIDAYSWLHKGAYSCSMELCLDSEGDKKYQFLKRRKANRDMAMEKLNDGDANTASELFQRAVSVTPLMAHRLIQILRSENIEFVVAPYEADAQLAYLAGLEAEEGGVVAVISEDSDLLAYGCPAIVFKMDRYGNGEEIMLNKVFNADGHVPSFKNFDRELFTGMCVMAGCDFLPSVPGIGIAKAYNLVAKYRNLARILLGCYGSYSLTYLTIPSHSSEVWCISQALSVLKFEKGKIMPEDYDTAFKEALAVFQHARVYDIVSKQLKPLKPLPAELLHCQNEELDFLGPYPFRFLLSSVNISFLVRDLSPSLVIAIAEGNLDPCTMQAFDYFPQPGHDSANRLLRQEEPTESTEEDALLHFLSTKHTEKELELNYNHNLPWKLTGDTPLDSVTNNLEERKPKEITQEVLHASEALALEKLAFPLREEVSKGNQDVSLGCPLNIPNNNPFKKWKQNEVQLNQTVPVDEQASEVTDIENSVTSCMTPVSQESVDSKPAKSVYPKNRRKSEKSLKQNRCNHVESKKSSILNFFSRV